MHLAWRAFLNKPEAGSVERGVMKAITPILFGALFAIAAAPAEAGWFSPRPTPPAPPRYDHSRGYDRGPSHQRVEARAQLRLRQLGYYRGPIDGQFGRGSRNALVRFQRDHRLQRTGMLDWRTLRALGIR